LCTWNLNPTGNLLTIIIFMKDSLYLPAFRQFFNGEIVLSDELRFIGVSRCFCKGIIKLRIYQNFGKISYYINLAIDSGLVKGAQSSHRYDIKPFFN